MGIETVEPDTKETDDFSESSKLGQINTTVKGLLLSGSTPIAHVLRPCAGKGQGQGSHLHEPSGHAAFPEEPILVTETQIVDIYYLDIVYWAQRRHGYAGERRILIDGSGCTHSEDTAANVSFNIPAEEMDKGLCNGEILCNDSKDCDTADKHDGADGARGDGALNESADKVDISSTTSKVCHLTPIRSKTSHDLVAGVKCSLTLHLQKGKSSSVQNYNVEVIDQDGICLLKNVVRSEKGAVTLSVRPNTAGALRVKIQHEKTKKVFEVDLDVESNNPICSFNEATFWPVALTTDHAKEIIYVAYTQHITLFGYTGDYVRGLVDLQDGYYNDLSLGPDGKILCASVSGFLYEGRLKNRFQEVHLYDVTKPFTKMLHVIGRDIHLRFTNPVLPVTFKNSKTLVVADMDAFCEINTEYGVMCERIQVKSMGSISRIAYHDKKYVVTDAATGLLKIYSDEGKHLLSIQIIDEIDEPVKGLMGLTIDHLGNIVVSDCLTGTLKVYDTLGQLVSDIRSEWDWVRWPVHVTTDRYGYVYVADHGGICIKKFRYL